MAGGATRINPSATTAGWVAGEIPQQSPAVGAGGCRQELWVQAGAGTKNLQTSCVAQTCCPHGRVALGLLGACLARAAGSWGVWVPLPSLQHFRLGSSSQAPPRTPAWSLLLSVGSRMRRCHLSQPIQAVLPAPFRAWGQAGCAGKGEWQLGRLEQARGPLPASLQTLQKPELMVYWHLPPLCHGAGPAPPQLQRAPSSGCWGRAAAPVSSCFLGRLVLVLGGEWRQWQIPGTMHGAGSAPRSGFDAASSPELL